jgi:hypothetical protein
MAEAEAQYNLSRAIEIAERVPTQTEAYAEAQLKLREWRGRVNQAPIETPPPTDTNLGF